MSSAVRHGAVVGAGIVALGLVGVAAWRWLRDDGSELAIGVSRPPAEGRAEVRPDPVNDGGSPLDREAPLAVERAPDPVSDGPDDPDAAAPDHGPPDGWPVVVEERGSGRPLAGAKVCWFPTHFDGVDFDRLLAEAPGAAAEPAAVVVTDAKGCARVPTRGDRESVLFATSGALRAAGVIDEEAPRPLRLELGPPRRVRVRVVDRAGRPRSGIPVRFGRFQTESDWDGYGRRAYTDSNGEATLDGVDLAPPRTPDSVYVVRVLMLGPEPVCAPIDVASPVPVELELPDCGTVVARLVDERGSTAVASGRVRLDAVDPDPAIQPGFLEEAALVDGVARWTAIATGLQLRVEASISSSAELVAEGAGPTRDGGTVELAIPLAQVKPWIVGRVEGAGGERLVLAPLLGLLYAFTAGDEPGSVAACQLVTDSAGGFRIDGRSLNEAERGALVLRRIDPAGQGSSGARVELGRAQGRDTIDVGVLRLLPRRIVAAGEVVDDAGRPVAGAECSIETGPPAGSAGWMELDVSFCSTAADGRFAIFGPAGRFRGRLRARKDGHLDAVPVEFSAGELELRVVLQRPGRVAGSVRVEATVPADLLRFELRRRDPPFPEDPGTLVRALEQDGSFELADLRPGSYDAALKLSGPGPIAEELVTIPRLLVVGGETCVDPRLQPIDVVGRVRPVRVQVLGPDGEAPSDALLHAYLPRRPLVPVQTRELEDGVATFATLSEGLDVEVWARGCRIERIENALGDVLVRLRRGLGRTLTVRVAVPGGIGALPFHLAVELAPAGRSSTRAPDWLRAQVGGGGEARLEVPDPGRWEVRLVAEHVRASHVAGYFGFAASERHPIDLPPAAIEVDERPDPLVLSIGLDSGAIADASRRLGRDRSR